MTPVLALDVSVGTWMHYAMSAVASHLITALPILVSTFALLYFVVGMVWGKCWNTQWRLGKSATRWVSVAIASLVAAFSLTCVDSLYGSNFFRTAVSTEVQALPTDADTDASAVSAEDSPNAKLLVDGLQKMLHIGPDSDDKLLINQAFVDSYSSAVSLFWGLFFTSLILLIGGIPVAALREIKVISAKRG